MLISEFISRIISHFGFEPTADQRQALKVFAQFLADRSDRCVMIMRGSAGTGKTSLAAAMVATLKSLGQKLQLMAPTGRAAKVFSVHCHLPASTIHRRIYRRKSIAGSFNLNDNLYHNALFVVDEASMVSSQPSGESVFSTHSLLDDLLEYVYGGQNCRLLLIGDKAQLPPVGEEESPALQAQVLEAYGLHVYECDLNEVVRQRLDSGILWNATQLRALITHDEVTQLPKIRFQGFADIVMMPGAEIVESIASSYSHVGEDETIVVTRSNKRANIYNIGIRNTVLDREEELSRGDQLMVVRNKYLSDDQPVGFIANGDRAEVVAVHNFRNLYGFHFADVTLRFPDYDDFELTSTALLDTLHSDAPALTPEQSQQLFERVMEDYADLPHKTDRLAALKNDEYYNALQIKYAYAVTCHKAQGGQWAHVYLDQGYMTDDMLTPDYIHWLYTAFTRATEKLFLVNWPKTQTLDS
ncbi:MAG: ATP-dependent DNA helicase [Prevotella sp.]|jgi:ATP-dependent exoDNAse (exonuclease V) alpha subunit